MLPSSTTMPDREASISLALRITGSGREFDARLQAITTDPRATRSHLCSSLYVTFVFPGSPSFKHGVVRRS